MAETNHETNSNKSDSGEASVGAQPVDGKTVPEAYLRRVKINGPVVAYRYKKDGNLLEVTWDDHHKQVVSVFSGLKAAGISKGDRVCILSNTRPEWMMLDTAITCSGMTTVPIYYSNTAEDVAYILGHCEAKLVFAEDEAACNKLAQSFAIMKKTLPVVTLGEKELPMGEAIATPLKKFMKPAGFEAADAELRKVASTLSPESMATIVYTSGTTGQPKGAVLTHSNITSELRALCSLMSLSSADSTITFLPMAHIMGRIESLIGVFAGVTLNFAENMNVIAQNITELKPTLLVSVPRIYEKIYSKIQSEIQGKSDFVQNLFHWSVKVGREYVRHLSDRKPVPVSLMLKHKVADRLVLSAIRQKLGGRIRITISGGAPLSRDLCEFFHACGIKIMEAYGLTETTAAITANRPDDYCFGTVGRTMPGVELKLAADGEILARGNLVFREYYKNEQATKETLLEGGWFATGDIGEFTERGFLKITDRKKELIVTSGGKNIAPQKLENCLKGCRFISNAMVYGDKEKYLVVLIALNEPEVKKWAESQGVTALDLASLVKDPKVNALIDGELKKINTELASYETIKKFTMVPGDFTVETGELTPSLKLKRKYITQKYRGQIDKMYGG